MYLRVCFLTLIERKLSGYVQNRKGPSKIALPGSLQPAIDGGKLILKFTDAGLKLVLISPPSLAIIRVISFPTDVGYLPSIRNLPIHTAISSIFMVYLVFLMGWESRRAHGVTGGLRRSSQTIAHDVVLLLTFVIASLTEFRIRFKLSFSITHLLDFVFPWTIVVTTETNRRPHDSAEGEREPVPGLNIEYMGVLFAFLLIAEYGIAIVLSRTSGISLAHKLFFTIIVFVTIIIRGFIPRSRHDLIIVFRWKYLLTYSRFLVLKII